MKYRQFIIPVLISRLTRKTFITICLHMCNCLQDNNVLVLLEYELSEELCFPDIPQASRILPDTQKVLSKYLLTERLNNGSSLPLAQESSSLVTWYSG